MSLVPISEVVATAQSTIKDADSMSKLIWMQWVGVLCLPELGTSEDDIKIITLYPENFTAPKPDDMKGLIDVALYDVNGCLLPHTYRSGSKRIYPNTLIMPSAVVGPPDTTSNQLLQRIVPVDISDDPYSFFLGSNGNCVKSIIVRYYFYPTDENGLPLIRQEETLAIIYFLRFMWSLRNNDNQSEIAMNEQRWKIESDRIRARKKLWSVSHEKMKTITRNWVRGLPNFNMSQF